MMPDLWNWFRVFDRCCAGQV